MLKDSSTLTLGEVGIELGTFQEPSVFKEGFSTSEPLSVMWTDKLSLCGGDNLHLVVHISLYFLVVTSPRTVSPHWLKALPLYCPQETDDTEHLHSTGSSNEG